MPKHRYFWFVHSNDPRVAMNEDIDDHVQSAYRLCEGVRMKRKFPKSTTITLAPTSGDMLTDFLENIYRIVIPSGKARAIMEAEGVTGDVVEYLPFNLLDKKGRKLKCDYSVANALLTIKCVDKKRTVCEYHKKEDFEEDEEYVDDAIIDPTLKRLCLDQSRLPPDAKFFRLGELPDRILLRSDLVERLRGEGCTGLSLIDPAEGVPF